MSPMPPVRGRSAVDIPLSQGQRALWFLQRLRPEAGAWNIAAAARVRGIDPARMRRAFERLAERHEALRLGFHDGPEGPVQRLRQGEAVDFAAEDVQGWTEERLQAALEEEAGRPFDLEKDPLLRVRVLGDVVLLVVHHLVADLGSLAVMVREIGPLYDEAPLPAPPLPYSAFVDWQQERLAGRHGERQWEHWRDRLAGELPVTEVPADHPRPPLQTFRGGSRVRILGPESSGRLGRLAAGHRATPFVALLAGLDVLLYRATAQTDLLVGSPTAGRTAPGFEETVGYFVNPVVLRSDLSGSPGFGALLERARGTALRALRHQEYPFARLVERLQPDRDPSRPPVFQVMLAYQKAHLSDTGDLAAFALGIEGAVVRTGSLVLESLPLERRFAQLDLELMAAETSRGIELALAFNADLYEPETAERLLGHLEVLLEAAVEDPERPVGELPLLTRAEQDQLREWNRTCAPLPGRPVHELFHEQAARDPERIAVAAPDGSLTYGELSARVHGVASALEIEPEEPVAVRMERGAGLLAALLGILEAGGAYLPLNPDHPQPRRERMLEKSGARVVLELPLPRSGGGSGRGPVSINSLAYLLFTSGSTGDPKGVLVPHRGLLNHLQAKIRDLGLTAADRVAQTASQSFDISLWQLLAPLLVGAAVEVIPNETVRDPARLLAEIESKGVTILELVPSVLAPLLDEIERAGRRPALRRLISTGEALPPELARRCLAMGLPLINGYGPTECADRVSHAFLRPDGGAHTSIGRPIPNLRLHVLSRDLQPQPVGYPGEVCIAGAGVGRGYLDDPARTADAFRPDPFGSGERLYRTGDLGRRRPDGEIEVHGRLDHQIKVRGVRIEPGEIEAALLAHPEVREAAVALRDGRLVAYWSGHVAGHAADHVANTAGDLREHLRSRLPDAMVPSVFHRLDALPLTPHGKVDRRALPAPASRDAAETAAPGDELERLLAQIFAGVLGRDRVGLRDDFFALGGHSLLAAQVAARVRSVLGIDPPVRLLFEEPTAAGLARRLRGLPALPPLKPVPRGERIPLSFAQHRLWFLHRLDPDSPAYNMPGLVRLKTPLDPAALSRVVERHETLRTTFPEAEGEPYQEIAPPSPVALPVVDLSALPDPESEARRLARAEARRPFDLARGPLLRVFRLDLGEDHRLFVNLHHIVGDGWSLEIFLREISGAPVPPLPVQYADYAVWQRSQAVEAEPEAAVPLELPLDRPRPPRRRYRGARLPVRIPARLARSAGATPFMVLLAGFQTLLHRLSGQDDIRVGSPAANRRHVEVEGLIGLFMSTLALRTRFDAPLGLPGLIERVRGTVLEALARPEVPREDEAQAMLALQPPGGLSLPVEEIDNGTAKLELTLSLREVGDRLEGWAEHDTDLFDTTTIARWMASLLVLLEGGMAEPEVPVQELPLLGAAERGQLVVQWNDTRAPVPAEPVHRLFAARAARTPDALALDGLTYRELDVQSNRLAHRLRRLGVGPETAVGVRMERSPEMVVALLGILKSGGFYVPLDPAYPAERLAWMIEDSGARLVLSGLDLDGEREDALDVAVHPEGLAYTIFTSGSTGRPKGVQVPHGALTNFLASMAEQPGLRPADTLLAVTTLSFDIAALELLLPLTLGARVILASRETASDGSRLAAEAERATVLQATPATWRLLVESGWTGSPRLTALCGGEALPRELARALLERTAALWNLYGPTETTVWSAVHPVTDAERAVPIGRPIANTAIHVVNGLEPAPVGVPGELWIGGAGVARGYAGRPDLTAERFVPDPFGEPGARLYRTGDLARRLADGTLEVLGRLDHQVKVRGFRIELEEVEAALEACAGVSRAVAAVRGDRLAAWIVGSCDAADLRKRLPEFMIPSPITAVDALPLTPNGKVDRRALPDPAPVPQGDAPAGPVEEAIAAIWSQVLGTAVGRSSGFFELGGHSLLATRVLSRVNETFGTDLPLRALFEAPTVAGLARLVASSRRERPPAPPFRQVPRSGPLLPSFAQERLWVMDRLAPDNPVYNVFQALDLDGPLDEAALERALSEVTRRHESLRTRFATVQGRPMQVIEPPAPRSLPVVDLRGVAPAEADRLARAEARRPFDLRQGPLVRATLLRLGETRRRLLLTLHHIVCDDGSIGILVREVVSLYQGQTLPGLPFQYADYADWQRRWLAETLEGEIAFWKDRLGGSLPVLDLPADRPRPAVQTFRGAALPVAVPAPLTAALRERSLRSGATLFMTLLAAFASVLQRESGQDDLVLGTPVAGRGRIETEGLIGLFVNVLPLRLDLSGSLTWTELLARVRAAALEAYDHQDVPFEKLVEALQPKRDLGRAALRQAGFSFQDAARPRKILDLPGGVSARPVAVDPGVSRLDLTLFLAPEDGGLAGFLEHSTDLFDRSTADRLARSFRQALEGIAAREERPLLPEAPVRARAPETNLTEGQLLFWFAHKLHPGVQLYFDRATATFTIEGEIDPERFERAFDLLLESCDVLRSRVREVGGVPWRSVAEPAPFLLEIAEPDDLGLWLEERGQRPMDLGDRLFDTALLRAHGRWVWFLSIHHLVADAWTLELLARRLSELYLGAEPVRFPSYEEYVAAERAARGGRAQEYWERKLSRPAPPNPFYSRPGAATTRTARLSTHLDEEARAAAARLGLFSPSVVFAAALFALLHRLSGEPRLRIGTPLANRPARFRGTPGLMMNAVPLEAGIDAGETFASLVRKVQRETIEVSRHQGHPVRNPEGSRVYDVYFNYQSVVFRELCGRPVRFELLHTGHSLDHLDLQVSDFAGEGRFRLDLDFNQGCFDAGERERTLGHLLNLLRAFLADPDLRLAEAPMLSEAEHAHLAAWNATDTPYRRGVGLCHLIEEQIARTPHAIAVTSEAGSLTYRELGERAGRLAASLQRAEVVGVRMERSLELMVALVGILKAGAAYVPLDPGYPADRLALMVDDSGVPIVLQDVDVPAAAATDARPFDESGLAYVIYTSGSTGRPKGVMVPHAGICNRLLWMQQEYGLGEGDRVLQKTPVSFDVSVWELFWPLITGARLVMARPGGHQDPAYLASTIVREQITTIHFVPSMLQVFLEQPGIERCADTLARVICSGEALSDALRRRFHERLPGVGLHNLYGPTEASVDVTFRECRPDDELPFVPIGRPIANTRIHLLDADGNLVPPGIPGELHIGGVSLARGYLGRPGLTAERFVPDPFGEPGARLYKTGDLARWLMSGELEYLGRIDHQVKIRGVRIELGEIEAVLARFPGVREAVVDVRRGREDRPGDHRLAAWYVPEPGRGPSPDQLRGYLRTQLPETMVPSAFVALDAMPLTPSGKADRRALPDPSDQPVPEIRQAERTPLESLVAGVCSEVLGVDDVPVDVSFFDLGGNSLMATQVVTLLQEVLPIELDLRRVFEGPTVTRLAAVIEEERALLPEMERLAMAEILAELERSL